MSEGQCKRQESQCDSIITTIHKDDLLLNDSSHIVAVMQS